MQYNISYLRALEAESIHIMREVASEFQKPVMLYSIGKDSSVMLRLAQKAFHPEPIPFPLLHIDTSYKFKEMIEFRDAQAKKLGVKLIVHTHQRALDEGANPFRLEPSAAANCSRPLPCSTHCVRVVSMPPSAARVATKNAHAPRSGSIPSAMKTDSGSPATSGPSYGTSTTAG